MQASEIHKRVDGLFLGSGRLLEVDRLKDAGFRV